MSQPTIPVSRPQPGADRVEAAALAAGLRALDVDVVTDYAGRHRAPGRVPTPLMDFDAVQRSGGHTPRHSALYRRVEIS